ncbi:MAG: ABC transporter permease [Anaerolineae bacterium]|nr:ABC transporter permease [Anaerolineae bacterium]
MSSQYLRLRYRAMRSPQFIAGGILILLFVLAAVLGPMLSPYSPTRQQISKRYAFPSLEFLMGTDNFGRDIMSRILHGSMASLQVGIMSVAISLVIGVILGLIAGYWGGWLDTVVMGMMDVLFAFPAVLLAIAILAVFGPGLSNVILAIGIVNLPVFARLTRGSTLAAKNLLYVEASRSLGVSPIRVTLRHILPNILAPLIVQTSLTIAAAILTEAALSYLGLGVQEPSPSWGNILSAAYGFMQNNPWPSVFPGVAIGLAVLGFNLLGDGLRDVLDPTTR